ncbi:MAG TPA: hypothetical protein QF624_00095 [Dehalococcoidia bacterium]|nr:hypothetical protein [Dehalococcoidia bacterium]
MPSKLPEPSPAEILDGDAVARRNQARQWANAQLAAPPWADRKHRLTTLIADPPLVPWASGATTHVVWLLTEMSETRDFPRGMSEPLRAHGAIHEPLATLPDESWAQLVIFDIDRLEKLIDGVAQDSMEARWAICQAEALHDPLRRLDALIGASRRIPEGGLDRAARVLYIDADRALEAVSRADPAHFAEAITAAGEASGAISRLACLLDAGMYPPAQWIAPATAETDLGARFATWLADIPRAIEGDAAAARRVIDGCDGVWRATQLALQPLFGSTDWYQSPETWALRAAR